MDREYCAREKEIIQALRRGSFGADLEKHARSCPLCADAMIVSRFLQNEFSPADATQPGPMLPDADFLWWRGQLAAKKAAVERATRSIELVRKASFLAIGAAAVWLLFAPGHLSSLLSALSNYQVLANGSLKEAALVTATGAIIFTIVSSLYLARAEK